MSLVPDIQQFPTPCEEDLMLFRVGQTDQVRFTTLDPLAGPGIPAALCDDADAGKLEIIDDKNVTLQNVTFPEAGGNGVRKVGEGIYEYDFGANQAGVWACLYRLRIGKAANSRVIRKQHIIRATSHRYLFLIPMLRELLDKSRKRARTLARSGRQLNYGFTDAQLATYLEIGMGLINAMPPQTSFAIENFPLDSSATSMLIYAGFIVGLEAQSVYALDTDVNYQFSGNSINVDHLTKIGQVLAEPGLANFKDSLSKWKQMFRPRGVALVQMQTSFSLGRLVMAIPGQFTRLGYGIGPSSMSPMA